MRWADETRNRYLSFLCLEQRCYYCLAAWSLDVKQTGKKEIEDEFCSFSLSFNTLHHTKRRRCVNFQWSFGFFCVLFSIRITLVFIIYVLVIAAVRCWFHQWKWQKNASPSKISRLSSGEKWSKNKDFDSSQLIRHFEYMLLFSSCDVEKYDTQNDTWIGISGGGHHLPSHIFSSLHYYLTPAGLILVRRFILVSRRFIFKINRYTHNLN